MFGVELFDDESAINFDESELWLHGTCDSGKAPVWRLYTLAGIEPANS
jgi:hypothetical protein